MIKPSYLAIALLATSHGAQAQQQVPSAGTQLQQIPLPQPLPQSEADLKIDRPDVASSDNAGETVRVSSLRVTGSTVFAESELITASGFAAGDELTLGQLRSLAAQIAGYYHSRGYFLAQAYLPAQAIADGVVMITVIEGRYGRIDIRNAAGIASNVPARAVSGLSAGDLISNAPLERRLLLLSDIPGVRTEATLAPGADIGTSDLILNLSPGPLISGYAEADNAGSRYTGRYRFGGTVNLNNPASIGDLLSVRLLASNGGLGYGRAAYSIPVGSGRIGAAYAHLRYDLGREFKVLDGSGTANIFSAFGSYPLIRSRSSNLHALASFDYKILKDEIGAFSNVARKHLPAATIGLSGDFRDNIAGGGSNIYSISWTSGELEIRSPVERQIDAATARSDGGFNKAQASFARVQSVAGPLSIYVGARVQLAFDNLDSAEKMQLGGAYGVRAYPEGETFGDSGYVATAEARLRLDPAVAGMLPGAFELFAFVDTGEVQFAHDPWFAGSNHAQRSGFGAGLAWLARDGMLLKGSYARKLGDTPATSGPDDAGRFWFQAVKSF